MKGIDLDWQHLLVAFATIGTLSGILLFAHYKRASTRAIKAKSGVCQEPRNSFPRTADVAVSMHLPI
jgi:hypothetical protein